MPVAYGTDGDDDLDYGAFPYGWTIYGGDGDDLLSTGGSDDALYGGAGDDRLWGGTQSNFIDGGDGSDTLYAIGTIADPGSWYLDQVWDLRIEGPQFLPDYYPPTGQVFTLISVENFHFQSGGNHRLSGNDADNSIWTWDGNDTSHGHGGNDSLTGNGGNDALYGGDGDDTLSGGAGDDHQDGGAGVDWLWASTGHDTIYGGADGDVVFYESLEGATGIRANLTGAAVDGIAARTVIKPDGSFDIISGVENIHGTEMADVIHLGPTGGYVFDRAGNDRIVGSAGGTHFAAGSGNDTFVGGAGGDWIDYFDDGYDTAGTGWAGGIQVTMTGQGAGTVRDTWAGTDRFSGIEGIGGSQHADSFAGSAFADRFSGADGDDTLRGAGGDDQLTGGGGEDTAVWNVAFSEATFTRSDGAVFVRSAEGIDTLIDIEWLRFVDRTVHVDLLPFNAAPTGAVTISGAPREDGTLTAETATIADADGLGSFGYQWFADGAAIAGATGRTLTLGQAQVGQEITVRLRYTDGNGTVETLTSDPTGAVQNVNDAPTGELQIVGDMRVGATVHVDISDIADADGFGHFVGFMWYRDGAYLGGGGDGTGNPAMTMYELGPEHLGEEITVSYTYVDAFGTEEVVFSAPYLVGPAPNSAPTGAVTLSGTGRVGQTLTADAGAVGDADGIDPATVAYQWLRDGTPIAGATGRTHVLTAADAGRAVSLRYSYTDLQGTAEAVTSAALTVAASDPAVIIAAPDLQTGEDGDTAVLSVSLATAPVYPVTITFAVSDPTEATLPVATLTFTAANWNIPQTVILRGVDDDDDDGMVAFGLTGTISTEDLSYLRVNVPPLAFTNRDDGLDRDMQIYGENGIDYLSGNNGDDRIYGGGNLDELRGGRGDDRLYGEQDDDRLYGDEGADWLYGGYDDDRLFGGDGHDELYGDAGADSLTGGAGNDLLDGGTGADRMSGGAGDDTYYVDNANDVVADGGLASDADTVILMATITYALSNTVENAELDDASGDAGLTGNQLANLLRGNDGDNALTGGGGADTLLGNDGDDALYAGDGDDTVDGGAGNDLIVGGNGAGNDVYRGGAGTDAIRYTSATAGIAVNLATGTAQPAQAGRDAGIGRDRLSAIEAVTGGNFGDRLTGDRGANRLEGMGGNDLLSGGAGKDSLIGGLGADRLSGGTGADRLSGGAGADIFVFRSAAESGTGRGSQDRITDFVRGADLIDLSGIDAQEGTRSDEAFTFIGNGAFGRTAGELRFAGGILSADTDGNGRADFQIAVQGLMRLAADDFIL